MTLEERFIFQGVTKDDGYKAYWDKLDLVRFVSLVFCCCLFDNDSQK